MNLDELPVMDPEEPGKLLGMLRRKEMIAAYNQRLAAHRRDTEEEDFGAAFDTVAEAETAGETKKDA